MSRVVPPPTCTVMTPGEARSRLRDLVDRARVFQANGARSMIEPVILDMIEILLYVSEPVHAGWRSLHVPRGGTQQGRQG